MPQMGEEINYNTLAFFLHSIHISKVSTEDYLRQSANVIINLFTNPIAHLPYLQVGDKTKNALLEIAKVLNRSISNIIDLNPTKSSTN